MCFTLVPATKSSFSTRLYVGRGVSAPRRLYPINPRAERRQSAEPASYLGRSFLDMPHRFALTPSLQGVRRVAVHLPPVQTPDTGRTMEAAPESTKREWAGPRRPADWASAVARVHHQATGAIEGRRDKVSVALEVVSRPSSSPRQ